MDTPAWFLATSPNALPVDAFLASVGLVRHDALKLPSPKRDYTGRASSDRALAAWQRVHGWRALENRWRIQLSELRDLLADRPFKRPGQRVAECSLGDLPPVRFTLCVVHPLGLFTKPGKARGSDGLRRSTTWVVGVRFAAGAA